MFGSVCSVHGYAHRYRAWGPVVLRVVLGVILAVHGSQKLFGAFEGPGIDGTVMFFSTLGIAPAAFWAWVVALVEFAGGILLIFGALTSVAAVLIAINMTVALVTVHWERGFFVGQGGYEFVLILIAVAISLLITGPGKFAVDEYVCKLWCKGKSDKSMTPTL